MNDRQHRIAALDSTGCWWMLIAVARETRDRRHRWGCATLDRRDRRPALQSESCEGCAAGHSPVTGQAASHARTASDAWPGRPYRRVSWLRGLVQMGGERLGQLFAGLEIIRTFGDVPQSRDDLPHGGPQDAVVSERLFLL